MAWGYQIAEREVRSRGAVPSFKGHNGFTGTLCTSVNHEIVHGIPSPRVVLRAGDLVKIDAGAVVEGYHADAAATWVVGGDAAVEPRVRDLVAETRAALWDGIRQLRPDGRLGDVSAAIAERGERGGYGVVAEHDGHALGGHGIGRALHEDPFVANRGRRGRGLRLTTGLVFAIEPMFNLGATGWRVTEDGWTTVTLDGALSAHWEHTVAVTDDGPWVLTALRGEPAWPLDMPRRSGHVA